MRTLTILLLGMLTCLALAQGKAYIRFPSSGQREVWIQSNRPTEPSPTALRTEAPTVDLPYGASKSTDLVFVWDKTTGNIAVKTVTDLKAAGGWSVSDSDFKEIGTVLVRVQSGGKPVGAANVTLDDGRRVQKQLIDPSSNGEAQFFDVKPGSLKVTVEYKSDGKAAQPVKQLLEASLKRSDPVPSITIALPEPATPAVPPTASSTTPSSRTEPAQPARSSFLGTFVTYLVALGIAVGVGYAVFRFLKSNPDTVGQKLEQLGVQIPKPGDDPLSSPDPVVPAAPVRPQPPQKILLDDATPQPLASSAPVSLISPSPSTGSPRLVADNGDALEIEEGSLTVGREVGLGLSLVGESTVSRKHAEIRRQGADVYARDLGSTNGTFVNNKKLDDEVKLQPGDVIQFGSVRFRFEG